MRNNYTQSLKNQNTESTASAIAQTAVLISAAITLILIAIL